jgi:hypothetical protein
LAHNLDVRQIRENIFEITFSELGQPKKRGDVKLEGLGTVMIDAADLNYAGEISKLGYEPTFFVSRSKPLGGRFVVVGRQEKA